MNKLGGTSNSINNQMALNQQAALKNNIAKAQVTNSTTLGRQVNRTEDDVKKSADLLTPPKERVTLSSQAPLEPEAKTQEQPSITPQAAAEAPETAQSTNSKSAEALETFSNALFANASKEDIESISTQAATVDQANGQGGSGQEVTFAATALRHALGKLQAKMPNATKEQIREAAQTDPEIARWASIADSANGFLTEIKADNAQANGAPSAGAPVNSAASAAGVSDAAGVTGVEGVTGSAGAADGAASVGGAQAGPSGPTGDPGMGRNPFGVGAEEQAQMMADNVKTMQAIQNIYQQMWAEISKARAQRFQLLMETSNSINAMMMETHVNRMKTSDNHRKAFMSVILETAK